ncbi:MAG: hypothetical protein M3542_08120, partial [Acidobacteriota bacterium]|nr:hypothetical protein [Acidobacteriota bacterium]
MGSGGAGVPSTPSTSPAGVRKRGMGVVSGGGGGGSGAWLSVACVACGFREQPAATAQASRPART